MSAPSGRTVRPTPARVKEALFSILAGRIADARVLDLFAGSGALGFESLSRGAAHVTFVESARTTAAALTQTARDLDVVAQIDVIVAPAERISGRLTGRYDVVFADPPYAAPYPAATFAQLRARGTVDAQSVIVYEHRSGTDVPNDPHFELVRTARYGSVSLAFLKSAA